MITKMKKLTFLIYHKEYEQFLNQIRELGVVHIVEKQCGEMDDRLQTFMQKRTLYKNILNAMYNLVGKETLGPVRAGVSADEVVTTYEDLQVRIQELGQKLPQVDKDIAQMQVWGDFDWTIVGKLRDAGWQVQFYSCTEKEYDEAWETDYNAIPVQEQGGHVYFVTVTPGPLQGLDMEPLRLPSTGLSGLLARKAETEKQIEQAQADLKSFCLANYKTLEYGNLLLQGDIDLLKVKLNSERMADGAVVLLEGWIPVDNEEEVKNLPRNNSSADILEFKEGKLIPHLQGDLANYFREATVTFLRERSLWLNEQSNGGRPPEVTASEMQLSAANVNFSATSTKVRPARISFRILEDNETLEVSIYDYEPTDFLYDTYNIVKDYTSAGECPMDENLLHIRYHFKRVQ